MSGNATLGTDYVLKPSGGHATIPAGQSSVNVKLKAKVDHVAENTERAELTLQPGTGYQIGTPKDAKISILDSP